MIKAIIFDIGGVVYTGTAADFSKAVIDIFSLDPNSFNAQLDTHIQDILLGHKSFYDLLPISNSTKDRVFKALNQTYSVNTEVKDFILKLKDSYKVGCVSNAMDVDVEYDEVTNIKELFDPYINSCVCHIKKPSQQIFDLALMQLTLSPEECVYIDDKEKYLEIPKMMGFKTIYYTDNQSLFPELKSNGVWYH